MYNIGSDIKIARVSDDTIEINIKGKKARVLTEDMAAVIREELPADRANEMFAEIEEKAISKGKARVVVNAHKDIRAGEQVIFTIDVNRYLDRHGNATGIRTTNSGIIY